MLSLPLQSAEIYRRYDQQGRAYFSDRPHTDSKILELNDTGYAWYQVSKIYDGDTVLLDDTIKVRLAGINTPELEGVERSAEAGAMQAKAVMVDWLHGQRVRIETDVETHDRYGRQLAHLFTEDRRHINLELVKRGLAAVVLHPPNLKYQQALLSAQDDAETAGRGLWRHPDYQAQAIDSLLSGQRRGWRRLVGVASKIRPARKYIYLEFSDDIDMRIAKEHLHLFPPLTEYLGKKIEIRGWPARRKTHYSILVRHPSAIKFVDNNN